MCPFIRLLDFVSALCSFPENKAFRWTIPLTLASNLATNLKLRKISKMRNSSEIYITNEIDTNSTVEIQSILNSTFLTEDESQQSTEDTSQNAYHQRAKRRATEFQTNSKIELAELYWQCTGIGKIIRDPITGKPVQRCPHSMKPKLSPFPFFTNPFRIKSFGTAIPLFFLFITCCLVLLLVQYFGVFYLGTVFRAIYCQEVKDYKGLECSLFDADSYYFPPLSKFMVTYSEEVKAKIIIGVILVEVSIFIMYIVIFVFSMMKVKMGFELKEGSREARISEFTVMVERVNGNHRDGVRPVI